MKNLFTSFNKIGFTR